MTDSYSQGDPGQTLTAVEEVPKYFQLFLARRKGKKITDVLTKGTACTGKVRRITMHQVMQGVKQFGLNGCRPQLHVQ